MARECELSLHLGWVDGTACGDHAIFALVAIILGMFVLLGFRAWLKSRTKIREIDAKSDKRLASPDASNQSMVR